MTLSDLVEHKRNHGARIGRPIAAEEYRNRMDELFERVYERRRQYGAVTWWARVTNRHVVTVSKYRREAKPLPDYQVIMLNMMCEIERLGGAQAVKAFVNRHHHAIEKTRWRKKPNNREKLSAIERTRTGQPSKREISSIYA